MKRLWAAVLVSLWSGPVTADTDQAGRAVFEGLPNASGHVLIGSDTVPTSRFPCRSCHGRDGQGGTEGDAPAIDWTSLAQPVATRPGYDATSFARLLATGKTPSGQDVSRLMPRYALDEPTVQSLIAHLSALTAEQTAGIHPDRIVFGVPLANHDAGRGDLLIRALETALAEAMPANGLHGRRIAIRALQGDAASILEQAKTETIAVMSPPPSSGLDRSLFTNAGVPVIFPIDAVSMTDDPALVQSFYASRERVLDLLLAKAVADGCDRIAVAATPKEEEAEIRSRHTSQDMSDRISSEGSADCVLISGKLVAPDVPASVERLYVASGDLGDLHTSLSSFRGTIIVGRHEAAALTLAAARQIGSLDAHAMVISATLHDALANAGRDLTRASLISEIASMSKPDLGLAFSSTTPAASGNVVFQVFETGQKIPP
ncbi:c-type cytochrome [Marivita sp. S2033]|uniref:c-type cytochrome n=1 Tax=Marivita sp. S2033 TaxID=3373187 RepID=UPI003982A7E9